MLNIKRVKKIIEEAEKENRIKIGNFLTKTLIKEEEVTWSEIKREVFEERFD